MLESASDAPAELTLGHLFFFAAWAVGAFFVAWRLRFFRLPRMESSSVPVISGLRCLGAFLIYLGSYLVGGFLAGWLIEILFPQQIGELYLAGSPVLGWVQVAVALWVLGALLAALWTLPVTSRHALLSWREGRGAIRALAMGGLSWFLAFPIATLLGQSVIVLLRHFITGEVQEQVAVTQLRSTMHEPGLWVASSLVLGIAVPIAEEILFRGYLYCWLRSRLNMWGAMTISSVIFSLFHFSSKQGVMGNISLLTSLALLGGFLAYLYERERTLWAPIGLHITFNCMGILALVSTSLS